MKARQTRHEVTIDARLRSDLATSDAQILNASQRGLLLDAASPPVVGTYLELQAGEHVIIARVVWANEQYVGARTQDCVPTALVPGMIASVAPVEGVALARPKAAGASFDRSQALSRALQFACVVLFSVVMAVLAFQGVEASLAGPIALAQAALHPQARS
jgi:hypothetical protein